MKPNDPLDALQLAYDAQREQNTMLRALLAAALADSARIDFLEKNMPTLAAQIARNAISTPTLRDAIDGAMKAT